MQREIDEAAGNRKLLPPWPLVEEVRSRGLPLFALLKFAADGDNVMDARQLCDALLPWLNGAVHVEEWLAPLSWDSVYGRSRDISAY